MTEVTYYFNSRSPTDAWQTDPNKMVDGDTGTWAKTVIDNDLEICDGNTCDGSDLGTITKVEARAYVKVTGVLSSTIKFTPYFDGSDLGDEETISPALTEAWSGYYDITEDTNAPGTWQWSDIQNLDYRLLADMAGGTPNCAKVEIRVTYTPTGGGTPSLLLTHH